MGWDFLQGNSLDPEDIKEWIKSGVVPRQDLKLKIHFCLESENQEKYNLKLT